jgi:hypothetical protein
MRTAVIDGIHMTIMVIDDNDVAAAGYYHTAALPELMQGPNSDEIFTDCGRPRESPGVELPVYAHGVAPLLRDSCVPASQPLTT